MWKFLEEEIRVMNSTEIISPDGQMEKERELNVNKKCALSVKRAVTNQIPVEPTISMRKGQNFGISSRTDKTDNFDCVAQTAFLNLNRLGTSITPGGVQCSVFND